MARTSVKSKRPEQVLFKGSDNRLSAVRNNLVRHIEELTIAVKELDQKYIPELLTFLDPGEIVAAANVYRDAVAAKTKMTTREMANIAKKKK